MTDGEDDARAKSLGARALSLLSLINEPELRDTLPSWHSLRPENRKDAWIRLTAIPNIGVGTAIELVKAGLLEERFPGAYRTPSLFYHQWYRLTQQANPVSYPEEEDFGDLWIDDSA